MVANRPLATPPVLAIPVSRLVLRGMRGLEGACSGGSCGLMVMGLAPQATLTPWHAVLIITQARHGCMVAQADEMRPAGVSSHMYTLANLIGIVAGLGPMTAPTAMGWAAWSGLLALEGSWLAFFGYSWTPWIFTLLALGEFVGDQLPSTPSRTVSMQFGARLLSGAICRCGDRVDARRHVGGLLAGVMVPSSAPFGEARSGCDWRRRSRRSARRVGRRRHRHRRRVAHRFALP